MGHHRRTRGPSAPVCGGRVSDSPLRTHTPRPGVVPFRKATSYAVHGSGGEFNVAANLANAFGLRTAIATAMVDYPIGDLVAERVRAMGVTPFYRHFAHDGVTGPNIATVDGDRGLGMRPPVVF